MSMPEYPLSGESGFGCNNAWLVIILFVMIFGWGGNGFGGNRNAMNFNGLENAVGRLSDQQAAIARQNDNAICSLGYQTLDQTSKLGSTIQQGFNQTQAQLAECCCTTQRGIDSVNYNGAINTAAIQQTVTEQTQKVLDTITGNRMADMQNQINQLQLSQAMCGVVRYPNTFAYNAGPSPFCGNGCCSVANI